MSRRMARLEFQPATLTPGILGGASSSSNSEGMSASEESPATDDESRSPAKKGIFRSVRTTSFSIRYRRSLKAETTSCPSASSPAVTVRCKPGLASSLFKSLSTEAAESVGGAIATDGTSGPPSKGEPSAVGGEARSSFHLRLSSRYSSSFLFRMASRSASVESNYVRRGEDVSLDQEDLGTIEPPKPTL